MPAVPSEHLDVQLQSLSANTTATTLKALVSGSPVLILAVRRPGCVLCRAQAQRVWKRREELEQLGFKLACVVHQGLPAEVKAFTENFWTGALYLDESKSLYKLIHGGRVKKGGILSFFNAKVRGMSCTGAASNTMQQVWARIRRATQEVENHNLTGDGTTLGGILLFAKDGTSFKAFPEKDFGDYPEFEEVVAAAAKLKA